MADLTFNIPDEVLPRVLDGLAEKFGYTPEDGDKAAFVRERLRKMIVRLVKAGEAELARRQAQDAPDPEVT